MRVVSWNMGCGPIAARYRKTHTEAWHHLLDTLRPDVAFVQEALLNSVMSPDTGSLIWSATCGTDSGTAVFVRQGLQFRPLVIQSDGSFVAGVESSVNGTPLLFISIHVGPPRYMKHCKALALTLAEVTAGHRFVVGGDWNAARHWDTVYRTKSSGKFFADLAARQMVDCHWQQHGKEEVLRRRQGGPVRVELSRDTKHDGDGQKAK